MFLGLPLGESSQGKDKAPDDSAFDDHLLWGSCTLKSDPENSLKTWPALCLKPRISSQVFLRQDVGNRNQMLNLGRVYSGLHLHEYVSLHGEWLAERLFVTNPQTNDTTYSDYKAPLQYFAQFGNVALSHFRASVGNFRMPFGIDYRPLMEVIDEIIKDDKFWDTPRWGARLTYDTLISSQYDIAVATSRYPFNAGVDETQEDLRAFSARMMFDIAAIEGFRFVFSGYGESKGERRGGAGFVTTTARGDTTTFEWIRLLNDNNDDNNHKDYDQLFRLSYGGGFHADTRWVAEYEDVLLSYRLATVGCDFLLPDYGLFRTALSYRAKSKKSDHAFVVITSGIQFSL